MDKCAEIQACKHMAFTSSLKSHLHMPPTGNNILLHSMPPRPPSSLLCAEAFAFVLLVCDLLHRQGRHRAPGVEASGATTAHGVVGFYWIPGFLSWFRIHAWVLRGFQPKRCHLANCRRPQIPGLGFSFSHPCFEIAVFLFYLLQSPLFCFSLEDHRLGV